MRIQWWRVGAVVAPMSVVLVAGCGDASTPAAGTDPTPSPPARGLTPDAIDGQEPPSLVLRAADGSSITALQGSSCWGNGCFDAVVPDPDQLPDVGDVAVLDAAFPVTGQWSVQVADKLDEQGCSSYRALVEPVDDTHLRFTPSGPPGERIASYFVRGASGGDTSGEWRWTVPERDGTPLAWVSITQNSRFSGGEADLRVVVDDAAVDGEVSATVVVTDADGHATRITPSEVDQHCHGDGYVEIGVPDPAPDRQIDSLGPRPYSLDVALTIDGRRFTGHAAWAPAEGVYGGDARLNFDEPLPQRTDR